MNAFANILAAFGSHIGMEGLCPDEKGSCALQFDDVVVNLEYSGEEDILYIYSRGRGLPEDDADRLALYGFLLELNSFFRGTDGGVLGIEPSLDAVTYTVRTPLASLDEIGLDALLGRHVNAVESLRASIEELGNRPVAGEETRWTGDMLRI